MTNDRQRLFRRRDLARAAPRPMRRPLGCSFLPSSGTLADGSRDVARSRGHAALKPYPVRLAHLERYESSVDGARSDSAADHNA
jgi:hypothetical protein